MGSEQIQLRLEEAAGGRGRAWRAGRGVPATAAAPGRNAVSGAIRELHRDVSRANRSNLPCCPANPAPAHTTALPSAGP